MAALHPYIVAACALTWCGLSAYAYYDPLIPSLQQLPGAAPDSETASFLPRLAHKYRPPTGDWLDVADPRLYLLTENDIDESQQGGGRRLKRTGLGGGPSLSIVNPLDVLRQRLLLEIARRRMRQSEEKIQANREWLKTIGKRSVVAQDKLDDGDSDGNDVTTGVTSLSRWSSTS